MKKIIFIAGVLLLGSFPATVYAGSLNSYESEVVAAAQGVFESDGVKYKLDSGYVNQLISYLSSDEVDLNQDQRDKVLAAMNDYVEKGIKEGYLVPMDGQAKTNESSESSGETDQKQSEADTKEADQEKDKDTKTSDSEKKNSKKSDSEKEEDTKASKSTKKDTESTSAKDSAKDSTLAEQKSDTSDPAATITPTQAPEDSAKDDEIIKNTGFNFNRTVYMAVGIGVLMMLGIMITYRQNYFAHSDE